MHDEQITDVDKKRFFQIDCEKKWSFSSRPLLVWGGYESHKYKKNSSLHHIYSRQPNREQIQRERE